MARQLASCDKNKIMNGQLDGFLEESKIINGQLDGFLEESKIINFLCLTNFQSKCSLSRSNFHIVL